MGAEAPKAFRRAGARTVPGCRGWQAVQAYTLRAAMSHMLTAAPHSPHLSCPYPAPRHMRARSTWGRGWSLFGLLYKPRRAVPLAMLPC